MKLALVVALAAACGNDDHSAIEHHHEPLPKLKHLTGDERDEVRAAIKRGLTRAKAAQAEDLGGVVGDTIGTQRLHVVLDRWEIDGPSSASQPIVRATDALDACLGSAPLSARFRITVDSDGKATNAIVVGVGTHRNCVEEVLRGLTFPTNAIDYVVAARIVYN